MNPIPYTKWIVNRRFYDLNDEVYCAVMVPTYDEIKKRKLDNYQKVDYQKLSDIEKEYDIKLTDRIVQISKFGNGITYQETLPPNVIDIKTIEDIIYSKLYNKYNRKFLLGSYRDDNGDFVYVFVIPTRDDSSITDDMYDDGRILRIKEFPYLLNNNFRPSKALEIIDNKRGVLITDNLIDRYVVDTLMLDKWKKRLFDVDKYEEIWIFNYDFVKHKGYCIIPTKEEIKEGQLIDKDPKRIRVIHRYKPQKNCLLKNDIVRSFENQKYEKFHIPYHVLCKFAKDILILGINHNNIFWTIYHPIYIKNCVIFHTGDSDILCNFLRLPAMDNSHMPYIQYFESVTNRLIRLTPTYLEKSHLTFLRKFGDELIRIDKKKGELEMTKEIEELLEIL